MKMLRALFQDRLSAGVLAGTSGWLLVLNLFVAALTCGMTVPVDGAPQFVLCTPAQPAFEGADAPAPFTHDCPSVIGHDGDALLVAAFAPGADLGPAFQAFERVVHPAIERAAAPIDPGRLGLAPGPRGPPRFSA